MPSPYDVTPEELAALLGDEPPYRARQVWEGLHRRVLRPGEMTDLPSALRSELEEALAPALTEVSRRSADDGQTTSGSGPSTTGYGSRPSSWSTTTASRYVSPRRPVAPWPASSAPRAR